jgi:16S rRNA G966 N2-methylase RsmD
MLDVFIVAVLVVLIRSGGTGHHQSAGRSVVVLRVGGADADRVRMDRAHRQKNFCGPDYERLMRITGGQAGGRFLKVPKGMAVRPTIDRVKQALFNSLGDRVVDARVLELFAGSGALSLESLSRGAKLAVCVELAPRHADVHQEQHRGRRIATTNLEVRTQDVFAALPQLARIGRTTLRSDPRRPALRREKCRAPFDFLRPKIAR